MSLLREPPFMRWSIVGPKLQNIDGVAGKLMITSTNGEMDTSDSLTINTTTDTVDVNAQKGLFVAEAAVVDSGGVPVAGGGIIFVEDGKLKYRGATGTITTVADA
jgi:hypothetical protein